MSNQTILIIGCILGAYLLGSICSAILVCKCMNKPDPRTVGSKNPGATNVLRHGGRLAAILTLAGDILKGLVPVVVARLLELPQLYIAMVALAAFLGHLFPIYFKLKGGKGVATTFGIVFGLDIYLGLLATATWFLMAFIFRYSSLAALVMVFVLPFYCYFLNLPGYIIPIGILAIIVIIAHHENIRRLLSGKEHRFREKD